MSDDDEVLEEAGVVKYDLDTAICVGRLLCEDDACDAEQRGKIIAEVYRRLEALNQKEEEEEV